jgi:membrane-associated phospholipid phosphatase
MHHSSSRRGYLVALFVCALAARPLAAQKADSSTGPATFLTRRDLGIAGIAIGATGLLSIFDDNIAQTSQESRFQGSGLRSFTSHASKVNETTLTIGGIVIYGIGRLTHSELVTDVALHATESVVLASVASQVIRGSLGRTRPYVTRDENQYDFHAFKGFWGDSSFDYRSFPSIHMSSSMAVATVLTLETNRRAPGATAIAAPLFYAAALIPGLSRVELDQHWASDIFAGAFMGVFAGYKVVTYSHDHPNNRFDRVLLHATVIPGPHRSFEIVFSPSF